jgi:hypothetical protein
MNMRLVTTVTWSACTRLANVSGFISIVEGCMELAVTVLLDVRLLLDIYLPLYTRRHGVAVRCLLRDAWLRCGMPNDVFHSRPLVQLRNSRMLIVTRRYNHVGV